MVDCTHEETAMSAPLETTSVVHCPQCDHEQVETMPVDACLIRYTCLSCGAHLRPRAGDCCVFCSYGSVPCPPIQQERAT
jgi:transposase-like protein